VGKNTILNYHAALHIKARITAKDSFCWWSFATNSA